MYKQSTFGASRYSDNRTPVTIRKFARIFCKVGARDEVIDKTQKLMGRVIVYLIDIDNDGDAGFACPSRGLKRGGGIAAIEMENAGVDDGFAAQLLDGIR